MREIRTIFHIEFPYCTLFKVFKSSLSSRNRSIISLSIAVARPMHGLCNVYAKSPLKHTLLFHFSARKFCLVLLYHSPKYEWYVHFVETFATPRRQLQAAHNVYTLKFAIDLRMSVCTSALRLF